MDRWQHSLDLESSVLQAEISSQVPNAVKPQAFLRRREPSHPDDVDQVDYPSPTIHDTYDRNADTEITADVSDELLREKDPGEMTPTRTRKLSKAGWFSRRNVRHAGTLAFELDTLHQPESVSTSRTHSTSLINGKDDRSYIVSSSTTLVKNPFHLPSAHTPVPISTIFSRSASPLSLPQLDNFISSLPAPLFPSADSSAENSSVRMFHPMDRLAASKKTLADLEYNSTIPTWRSCNSILTTLLSVTIGINGSSFIASYYSVQSFFDTFQIFALLLSTIVSRNQSEAEWRTLLLDTIPNILALNLASSLIPSLAMLAAVTVICGGLLYYFYRITCRCCSIGVPEAQQVQEYPKHPWLIVIVGFILTVLYLPISTMAVHALVWSDDLWVVPNPYINATSNPPIVAPLGPADQYRDPLDFCWTTTMETNAVNYAPIIVIIAFICFCGLTVWFPIYLYRTIRQVTPIVAPFTELGVKRSNSDLNREYQRLLQRDTNPLRFLYSGYRRGWGNYQSIFLLAKLTTLLVTAIVDPSNCLFRSLSQTAVAVARQIVLLVAMLVFLVLQCFLAPFINPVNNASEWTSRLNYVLTSALALGVALNVPGKDVLDGIVLYIIYAVTYGLNFYFTVVNWNIMRRFVKRLGRRIDFSIDVFSPRIDLSPLCPHTKRRIWQEAITTLFVTDDDCEIPRTQKMEFAESRDDEYPPYLLGFTGTPGERFVENLRILREVGNVAYSKAVALTSGAGYARFHYLEEVIQSHFVGPDCYWNNPKLPTPGCTTFFGNAWWIPFPPTLVIRYDDGPLSILQGVGDLETYVHQNSGHHIQRKRQVRLALRALDGLVVAWPHDYVQNIGSRDKFCCCMKRYGAQSVIHYRSGVLSLKRHGQLPWEGVNLGSGFDVELTYAKDVTIDGSAIGLTVDFDLTPSLARFFALNERLIGDQLMRLEALLHNYRRHCRKECRWKSDVLTYHFLTYVYDQPRKATDVAEIILKCEHDSRVRRLVIRSQAVFEVTYERLCVVASSELATWWYIFWDDLWRRNYDTVSALSTHETDFNPHYPTSIAYRPLPRAALEVFLTQRGLLHRTPKFLDFFHAGFLNKMYLRMYDVVFHGSSGAEIFHLGQGQSELDMEEIDMETLVQPSTLGTGGGTDYDDVSIRARPYYRWEGILEDPVRLHPSTHRSLLTKVALWFGISPLWRSDAPSRGLALDVQLENGKYVLLGTYADGPT